MRAGAHRLLQSTKRFLMIPTKPQDAAEHTDPERTVRIERDRLASFGDRSLPFACAAPHPHVRQDGVSHCVFVVEVKRQ